MRFSLVIVVWMIVRLLCKLWFMKIYCFFVVINDFDDEYADMNIDDEYVEMNI